MPANPGRLVVSEKLKPSGTTSAVSDNSFPLVLVFWIINQLVCVHTCTEIQYIYWSTVVDTVWLFKRKQICCSGRIAFRELQYKIILIFLILDAALQFILSETNPLSLFKAAFFWLAVLCKQGLNNRWVGLLCWHPEMIMLVLLFVFFLPTFFLKITNIFKIQYCAKVLSHPLFYSSFC